MLYTYMLSMPTHIDIPVPTYVYTTSIGIYTHVDLFVPTYIYIIVLKYVHPNIEWFTLINKLQYNW